VIRQFLKRNAIYSLSLFLASVSPSTAGLITSISGDVEEIASPASFSGNLYPQNANAVIFQEAENLELSSGYSVDISSPGLYQSDAGLTVAQISAGTIVSTFILYLDAPNNVGAATGTITFSGTILGLSVISFAQLVPNINLYSGYELDANLLEPTADRVFLSQDLHTIAFCSKVNGATDGMRILLSSVGATPPASSDINPFADNCTTTAVASVPEPSTIALIAMALASLFGFGWMRRRAEA
jgi:hypothetical protein